MSDRLVLVRHGRTEWNAQGRFQGWADVALDPEGLRQAGRCAHALASTLGPSPSLALLSSDLSRAVGTARAVGAVLGAPVATDPALREVDVGGWEGLTRAEAEERFPDEYRAWTEGSDVARGGGETLAAAGRRVADLIQRELSPGLVMVVIGHGMSLQAAAGELRHRRVISFEGPPPHLGNACYLNVPFSISEPATCS